MKPVIWSRYDAVFVDFFDTVMFRAVTPDQVLQQWAACISRRYPDIPENISQNLANIRKYSFEKCRENFAFNGFPDDISEVTYEQAMREVFKQIDCDGCVGEEESFLKVSREIDTAVELGCQYANRALLKKIRKLKKKGKKIYIVSDFYLSEKEIRKFLTAAGISEKLFDGIFVSCDTGRRKAAGNIYPYLLNRLGYKARRVVMIGDNYRADKKNAVFYGIDSILQKHFFHKIWLRLKEKLNYSYGQKQLKKMIRDIRRRGKEYGEYISIFFLFTKRLYAELSKKNTEKIAFMAREGYYLKKLFDEYQYLLSDEKNQIETLYYRCSRRSILSGLRKAHQPENIREEISVENWLKSLDITLAHAWNYEHFPLREAKEACLLEESGIYKLLMKNPEFVCFLERTIEENRQCVLRYTEEFTDKGVFRFVDSGWKGTTQEALENGYGIPTEGYYIGTQKADRAGEKLKMHGLIFNEEPKSRYYDYLGMNIPFYQQLLAAPHGTAVKYIRDESGIQIKEVWDPIERNLYCKKIKKLQDYMFLKFMGCCAWDQVPPYDQKQEKEIARMSMKSSLFARGKRLKFIRYCTKHYVQNFQQEKRGTVQYDIGKVKMSPDMLKKPEKLLRYVSKIQRTELYDKRIIRCLYPIAAGFLYIYIRFTQTIRDIFTKSEKGEKFWM